MHRQLQPLHLRLVVVVKEESERDQIALILGIFKMGNDTNDGGSNLLVFVYNGVKMGND